MPSNPSLARDEVFGFFTAGFVDLPKPCDLRYQGKINPVAPRGYWARISFQQVMSGQSAFAVDNTPNGECPQVFETSGLIYVQVFAPITERDAFHFGDLLATKARDIFRSAGTPSGVWFRNARANELPFRANDTEYRWNVVVEYEYDERK